MAIPTGFNLNSFKSSIGKHGVYRPQYFYVNIIPPKTIGNTQLSKDISLRCETAGLPGIDLIDGFNGTRYGYGSAEFIPQTIAHRPVMLSFVIDEGTPGTGSYVHNYFLRWMNSIMNFNMPGGTLQSNGTISHQTTGSFDTFEVGFRDDYATTVQINQLATTGAITNTIELYQAFPISLSPIELSWNDQDQVARLNVVMTYRSFSYTSTNLNT